MDRRSTSQSSIRPKRNCKLPAPSPLEWSSILFHELFQFHSSISSREYLSIYIYIYNGRDVSSYLDRSKGKKWTHKIYKNLQKFTKIKIKIISLDSSFQFQRILNYRRIRNFPRKISRNLRPKITFSSTRKRIDWKE